MRSFIDQQRERFGVEPICKLLQVAPSAYWRHAARQRDPSLRSARARRDAFLMPHIQRVWQANFQVYGADKVRGGPAQLDRNLVFLSEFSAG